MKTGFPPRQWVSRRRSRPTAAVSSSTRLIHRRKTRRFPSGMLTRVARWVKFRFRSSRLPFPSDSPRRHPARDARHDRDPTSKKFSLQLSSWDPRPGQRSPGQAVPTDSIASESTLAVGSDNRTVIVAVRSSTERDQRLFIWDFTTGKVIKELPLRMHSSFAAHSPSAGRKDIRVAGRSKRQRPIGGSGVRHEDRSRSPRIPWLRGMGHGLAFSPTARRSRPARRTRPFSCGT